MRPVRAHHEDVVVEVLDEAVENDVAAAGRELRLAPVHAEIPPAAAVHPLDRDAALVDVDHLHAVRGEGRRVVVTLALRREVPLSAPVRVHEEDVRVASG